MEQPVVRSGAGAPLSSLLNPLALIENLLRRRQLILQWARRDIAARYRNSWLGLFWSVLTPLLLLTIYTFIFAVVLRARWGDDANESRGLFALTLYCGMLVFNVFSDVVNRAPHLIVDHANYVKKVVFPLEIFPVATLATALFNLAIGLCVWLVGWLAIVQSVPPVSALLLPVVMLPVALLALGLGWFLAAIGVFVRDVGHVVALVTQVLFFVTPIFYRVERIDDPRFRALMSLNPLTHAVEDARRVLLGDVYASLIGRPAGLEPQWGAWACLLAVAALAALLGYAFFLKSKRAFSDVL